MRRCGLARYDMDLRGRDLLKLLDYSAEEVEYLLDLAAELKAAGRDVPKRILERTSGRQIALIFEKTSTRTRCAFETAAHALGMHATYLDPSGSQIGRKESIADTARVLSRMFDGIEYRGYGQHVVEELAEYADVPVWNGLTDEFHPTQMLADLLTIREHFGNLKGRKLTYLGDARFNTGNSLMVACSLMGMHFTACSNPRYYPVPTLIAACRTMAEASGGSIQFTSDVAQGVSGADVVYTDIWVSMGEPKEAWQQRIEELLPYQVTKRVMSMAGPQAVFMHCLPSFHNLGTEIGREIQEQYGLAELEVTDEVFESEQSVVFDEAENRRWTIEAVIAATA